MKTEKNQPMNNEVVYAFMYNSDINESGYSTISLHRSYEGANNAMGIHKERKRKEWQILVDSDEDKGTEFGFDKICPFGQYEDWIVDELKVLD